MIAAVVMLSLALLVALVFGIILYGAAVSSRADSVALLARLAETEATLIKLRAREVGAHAAQQAKEMSDEELANKLNAELANPGGGS